MNLPALGASDANDPPMMDSSKERLSCASPSSGKPNPPSFDAKRIPRNPSSLAEASKGNNASTRRSAQQLNKHKKTSATKKTAHPSKQKRSSTNMKGTKRGLVAIKEPRSRRKQEDSTDTHSSDTSTHHDDDPHNPPTSPRSKRRKQTRSSHRMSWAERIQQLAEYKANHGDLLIPIRYKENPSLGKFVHNTREQYKLYQNPAGTSRSGKAKKCSLTAERVQQLEELGFVWSTERSKHQKEDWEARLQQLKDYNARHGDCLVPHGYQEDPSFAEWVHRQRTTHANMLKDRHHNPLVDERMKQLEALGFHFTVHADKWMEHWNELKIYRDTYGHCQVPTHCPTNPKLGRWVHTQRHQRRLQLKGKKSCMTDGRVRLLDSLNFSWEVRPHHHNMDDLNPLDPNLGPFQGEHNAMGGFLVSVVSEDVHAEGHSLGGSVNGEIANGPASVAADLECTFQAHQDGSDGSQVDFFARGMAMV